MDKSVARLNIEHYRKLLATDLDDTKRKTVQQLLAQEEATLARLIKRNKKPAAQGKADQLANDQAANEQPESDKSGSDQSGGDAS